MARNDKPADVQETASPTSPAEPQQVALAEPIVLKKKKRKKRYSRGTKGAQRLGVGLSRASYRLSDAVAEGLDTFYRQSNKSSRKKKDGFARDFLENSARGAEDLFKEAGKAPGEVAKRLGTRRIWRQARPLFRLLPLSSLFR
ncbi:MAG: hypothetical protein ABUT39_20365 [Acidobacteriota bacterium]